MKLKEVLKGACVLRNWDGALTRERREGDIDLIADREGLEKLREKLTLLKFHDTYHGFLFERGKLFDVHVHVGALSWNHLPYLEWDGKCRRHRGLMVPAREWHAAELLLHPIVDSKTFKGDYKKSLGKVRDWGAVEKIIAADLGAGLAAELVGLAKEKKWQELLSKRWTIIRESARRNPGAVPRALWAMFYKKVLSRFRVRRGPLFAFVGPDGAGKSTLIRHIRKDLEKQGLKTKVATMGIYNGRSLPLRLLSWALNWIRRDKLHDGSIPFEEKGLPAPGSLKTLVRFVDMWIRYLGCELARLRGKVVLADRYFYDLYFYSPSSFSRFLASLSPQPDKTFSIVANPEKLVNRKREYSENAIEAHLKIIQSGAGIFDLTKIKNAGDLRGAKNTVLASVFQTATMQNLFF